MANSHASALLGLQKAIEPQTNLQPFDISNLAHAQYLWAQVMLQTALCLHLVLHAAMEKALPHLFSLVSQSALLIELLVHIPEHLAHIAGQPQHLPGACACTP